MAPGDETAGVVEYLLDRSAKGPLLTTRHVEYIFEGQISRYHLDFSARLPALSRLWPCSRRWPSCSPT